MRPGLSRRWRVRSRTATLTASLLASFALASSCRSVGPRPQAPSAPGQAFDLESLVPKPAIRVGVVVDGKRAAIGAKSGVVVWLVLPGTGGRVERKLPRATFVYQAGIAPHGSTGLRLLETSEVATRGGVIPARGDEALSLDGSEYRGAFEVRAGGSGVTAINVLGLEDYLRGVVPNELSPNSFPEIEAQKAQAIAARTYAIRNKGQFAAEGYDLCATPKCQVYRGRSTEDPLSDEAVAETRGIVATYDGEPINALYTSTCGGHTENNDNVFEGAAVPYLRGVACKPERGEAPAIEADQNGLGGSAGATSKHAAWVVRLSADQVAEAVASHGNVGRVTHLKPLRLGVSGRVVSLLVGGDAGEVTLSGLKIRFTLGLKENLFVLDEEQGPNGSPEYVFTGRGWGHGVGLCQVGAYGLARGGSSHERILKHYYTGVSLARAYN